MKKLLFLAVCMMVVMISCKQKGQTAPADNNDSLAAAAVIDSIIEENDTTPLPMFLIGNDGKEFLPGFYYDHYDCSFTETVQILASDKNGRPVIGIGRVGKGFLGVFGTLPGHFGDSPNGSASGDFQGGEKQLLLKMIRIMRGGK